MPMQAKALAGAVDGGFADAEPSSDHSVGESLEEPTPDKRFLSFVELAWPARGSLLDQAIKAMLLVVSFPAALSSDGVAEGSSQLPLGGQLALPEHDTDKTHVWPVVQSDPIDWVMATEDDAVAVAIIEPQAWSDERATVG